MNNIVDALVEAIQNEQEPIFIHFIDDYTFDNVEDAINDFENRYTDLSLDGAEPLAELALEVLDRLKAGENNIVIDDSLVDIANQELSAEYNSDDEDIDTDTNSYYSNSNSTLFGNIFYNYKKYKKAQDEFEAELVVDRYHTEELTDKTFPTLEELHQAITNGNLIVCENMVSDFVIGKSEDVIATYEEYTINKFDPIINYCDLEPKVKKQISSLKNNHKPYTEGIMFIGTDLIYKLLYNEEALSHLTQVYEKACAGEYCTLYIHEI